MTNPKDSSEKSPAEKETQPQQSQGGEEETAGAGGSSSSPPKEKGETAKSVAEVGGGSSSVVPPRPTQTGAGRGGAPTRLQPRAAASASRAVGSGGVGGTGGAGGEQGGGGGGGAGGGPTAVATAARAPPSGSGGRAKRKASEIIGPVGVEMVCSVCKRDFGSWKALSGHMRSHPERQWRGIFPPPVEPRFAAAQGQQPNPPDQPQPPTGQGVPEERVALDVDLNQPHQGEEEEGGEEASPPPPEPEKDAGGGAFDLNMPPASGDGDE
ncbi:uncharacterized protein LOC107424295 [Ziziphus jujuba]|uniref:Uncharacterized protein LOC107424295 n=1 Tax=Ziziphus jujuba TaxID=326968 RepID=A0A6P4A7I2_ZIZJJ|nr:uncharacterized protein LOC107424295 [Ziziphus jujuba]